MNGDFLPHLVGFIIFVLILFFRVFKNGRFSFNAIISRFLLKRNANAAQDQPINQVQPVINKEGGALSTSSTSALPQSVFDRSSQDKNLPWASNLSVNDWLLAKSLNLKPLHMVLGTAVFHNGFTESFYRNMYQSQEMKAVEHALYASCSEALHRLQMEAKMLGADAVVDVKMKTPVASLFKRFSECTFIGTAVKIEGLPKLDAPLLCTVSMSELLKLIKAGSLPFGMAIGIGVYYQNNSLKNRFRGLSLKNQEMQEFTQASYTVKNAAFEQVKNEAKRMHGNGVLKRDMLQFAIPVPRGNNNDGYAGFAIHNFMFATVVSDDKKQHSLTSFKKVLDLKTA